MVLGTGFLCAFSSLLPNPRSSPPVLLCVHSFSIAWFRLPLLLAWTIAIVFQMAPSPSPFWLVRHLATQLNFLNVSWWFHFPHQMLFPDSSLARGKHKAQTSFLGVQGSPWFLPVCPPLHILVLASLFPALCGRMFCPFCFLVFLPFSPTNFRSLGPKPALPGCFYFWCSVQKSSPLPLTSTLLPHSLS